MRVWDGGVVPKNVGEVVVQRGVVGPLMESWVVRGDFLNEVLFVKEGKLCVKVPDGAFPKKFTVQVVGVGVVNVNGIVVRCIKGSLSAGLGEVVGHVVALDARV